jgi:tetratricopeptide (TPR) repeat protein
MTILCTFKNKATIIFVMIIVLVFAGCKDEKQTSTKASGDPDIDKISAQITANPADATLYYQRARLYYDKSAYDNTIIDLESALAIDSLNPDYYHLLADTYLDYYNSKGALNTMNKVLALYPSRIPSLLKLAEFKHILQDYDGSILTANEALKHDQQNAEAYFMLGMNFKALGDKTRAINAYQTAVEFDSGLTDAWIYLGELYEEKKDPKALKYYESAILSNPESMQAWHGKAFYLQNHGKITDAQAIYRDIIMKDKSYADAYLNSGLLYMETDSIDRAYEQFDLLTGVAPANYMGYYMRGIVQEKKGKKEQALKDYESAYNLNKDDKNLQKAIETLKQQLQ